jgi:hypothetical protein
MSALVNPDMVIAVPASEAAREIVWVPDVGVPEHPISKTPSKYSYPVDPTVTIVKVKETVA